MHKNNGIIYWILIHPWPGLILFSSNLQTSCFNYFTKAGKPIGKTHINMGLLFSGLTFFFNVHLASVYIFALHYCLCFIYFWPKTIYFFDPLIKLLVFPISWLIKTNKWVANVISCLSVAMSHLHIFPLEGLYWLEFWPLDTTTITLSVSGSHWVLP